MRLIDLPTELLDHILTRFADPHIGDLYELRRVCRALSSSASRALLLRLKALLHDGRNTWRSLRIFVDDIRSRRSFREDPRLPPFSLGRLLRAAGVRATESWIPSFAGWLCTGTDSCHESAQLLAGLGAAPDEALDALATLYAFQRHDNWTIEQLDEAVGIVLSGLDDEEFVDVMLRSLFTNDEVLQFIAMRLWWWQPANSSPPDTAIFSVALKQARRRFPSCETMALSFFACCRFLGSFGPYYFGTGLTRMREFTFNKCLEIFGDKYEDSNKMAEEIVPFLAGLCRGYDRPESEHSWLEIKSTIDSVLKTSGQRDKFAAICFARKDWTWVVSRWYSELSKGSVSPAFWFIFSTMDLKPIGLEFVRGSNLLPDAEFRDFAANQAESADADLSVTLLAGLFRSMLAGPRCQHHNAARIQLTISSLDISSRLIAAILYDGIEGIRPQAPSNNVNYIMDTFFDHLNSDSLAVTLSKAVTLAFIRRSGEVPVTRKPATVGWLLEWAFHRIGRRVQFQAPEFSILIKQFISDFTSFLKKELEAAGIENVDWLLCGGGDGPAGDLGKW